MKVIDQGITSASNIFNLMTDGDTRFDENTLNNMDDLMIFADSLPHLKEKVEEFLMFAQKKNLTLKMSKFLISKEVEFGGLVVSAELVQGEDVVNILPKHGRIKAFQNLKRPESKDLQTFCGDGAPMFL